jgi:type IV secretory pathway VirB4 component
MKINFTKKEYRLLVDMLYLSNWVMHSHAIGPEEHHSEYEELRKKLLSYYKEMGFKDMEKESTAKCEYYETWEYEEAMHEKFINLYEDQVFWDELTDRLAERDAVKEIGLEKFQTMEGMERINKIEEIRDRYANEFEQHGIDYVKIEHKNLNKN